MLHGAVLLLAYLVPFQASNSGATPKLVSFSTKDGGTIFANVYGQGDRCIVLAHGGQFNKESWDKQAKLFTKAGFQVLAIDFRGYGQSKGPGQAQPLSAPLHLDVLAAVGYLKKAGATSISVIGASMGGTAAVQALSEAGPELIEKIVVLSAGTGQSPPEKVRGRKMFLVAREDSNTAGLRLPKIQAQFDRMPEPKRLVILEGSAHAQFLFQSPQNDEVMREILEFVKKP